jgi:pimeloyl-ACP methyl ester carboxylesterase
VLSFPPTTFITADGIRLAAHTQGDGPLIVLCHGFPELAFSWRHQLPALSRAGYQVVALDQRGYGESDRPPHVIDYDIERLTDDLIGILDHYGREHAVFVGHDMGAIVVWNLALLHPSRVAGVINFSVPFMERGTLDWVTFWEQRRGSDFYIVHYNRFPGVADAAYARNPRNVLRNLFRMKQWEGARSDSRTASSILDLPNVSNPPGEPIMTDVELDVFVRAFERTGFTPALNWYRNFARNWELIDRVPQQVIQPTLMVYGRYDMVPKFARLQDFVPNLEVVTLDCGHWIQQERPMEVNRALIDWLARHYPPR